MPMNCGMYHKGTHNVCRFLWTGLPSLSTNCATIIFNKTLDSISVRSFPKFISKKKKNNLDPSLPFHLRNHPWNLLNLRNLTPNANPSHLAFRNRFAWANWMRLSKLSGPIPSSILFHVSQLCFSVYLFNQIDATHECKQDSAGRDPTFPHHPPPPPDLLLCLPAFHQLSVALLVGWLVGRVPSSNAILVLIKHSAYWRRRRWRN